MTLLNYEFYNERMKPVMAEWAYLWLQKHHLHGIDRVEAVQYLLEGAAARSDTSTKVMCRLCFHTAELLPPKITFFFKILICSNVDHTA